MAIGGETIGTAYIKILADGSEFEADIRRKVADAEPAAEDAGKSIGKARDKGEDAQLDKGFKARLARFRARMGLMAKDSEKFGDKVGKAFGKGSRNDFLNIVGGIAGAVTKALPNLLQWASGINKAGSASSNAAKQMSSAGESVSGLSKSFGVVGQVAIAAGALASLTTMLGAMGAAASLTTGLILALAGSLGFALVGALGAVAGAMVPFAAAIGVGALALGGLGKKNAGLKQLKDTWKDLQKTASKAVFGKDGAGLKNLDPILKSLKPLITGVGGALNGLLKSLGDVAKTDAFKDMMKGISDVLPGMVTQLGGIGGKLALGIGQAFVALGPIITEFLGFLDDIAGKFVAFGAGGKNSGLAKFFNDAWASAKIVGGLIMDIIDLIGILFSAGKGTGDQIFADIAKQVQEIVKWLSSAEGQKALKQWFADAKVLGEKLGDIVVKVVEFIDTLDSPQSREFLFQLLDGFSRLIGVITFVARAIAPISGLMTGMIKGILSVGTAIAEFVGALPAMVSGAIATFVGTVTVAFEEISTAILNTITEIGTFLAPAWNFILTGVKQFVTAFIGVFLDLYHEIVGGSIVPDMVNDIVSWFARLPGMIAGVLGSLVGRFQIWLAGVPQKIQSSIGLVVGAFSGLAGKAIARAGNIVAGFTKWIAGLPAKARAMATTVAAGFTNLAGKIISRAGSLASRFASWVSSLAGKAKSTAVSVISAFANLAGRIVSKAGNIGSKFSSWLSSIPGKAKTAANNIVNAFANVASKIISKMGSLASKLSGWGSSAVSKAKTVANNIVSAFSGLASRIVRAIGTIIPKIKMPSIPRPVVNAIVKVKGNASGGVFNQATLGVFGEAGPEAIVPLNRPLNQVDPAVRALSAFAQGIQMPGTVAAGPSIGRQIDVGGIVINTPTTDPRAVASEVVNRMTFAAYI